MGEYVTLGPMEMYYETAGDEGDPILFLHGGGGGAFVWEPHMAHFAPVASGIRLGTTGAGAHRRR